MDFNEWMAYHYKRYLNRKSKGHKDLARVMNIGIKAMILSFLFILFSYFLSRFQVMYNVAVLLQLIGLIAFIVSFYVLKRNAKNINKREKEKKLC